MLVQAALRTAEALATDGIAVGMPGAAILQVPANEPRATAFMPPSLVFAVMLLDPKCMPWS